MQFGVDYNALFNSVDPKQKTYKLADIKGKLVKVAFDVFRMKGGDPEELWQVQSADDGEYIVARYETPVEIKEAKANWSITKAASGCNVFYKNRHITNIAADFDDVNTFLPKKLASDKSFVKSLLSTLDDSTHTAILKAYPELSK
jgi:hypothetical protein